jgi:hypothetical protein
MVAWSEVELSEGTISFPFLDDNLPDDVLIVGFFVWPGATFPPGLVHSTVPV